MFATWILLPAFTWAGVTTDHNPAEPTRQVERSALLAAPAITDLDLQHPPDVPAAATAPPAVVGGVTQTAAPQAEAFPSAPWGFHRDERGRLMQVSFDLLNRVWLGVAYAPRRHPNGHTRVEPTAIDFGLAWVNNSLDQRTRYRVRAIDGEVRIPFETRLTAFRFDLSHRYERPLLRITTFFGEPRRYDLSLNVGLFTELLRFETAPRGVAGDHEVSIGTIQATLDLWQSDDLRSYVRLRAGPGADFRLGPWGEQARFAAVLPQTTLEANLFLDRRSLHLLTAQVRGDLRRSISLQPRPASEAWAAFAEGAYEGILIAVNDQPIALRLSGQIGLHDGLRDDDATLPPADQPPPTGSLAGLEWKLTAGARMSFFAPPLPPRARP